MAFYIKNSLPQLHLPHFEFSCVVDSVLGNRGDGTFPSSQEVLLGSTALEYFHTSSSDQLIFVRECWYLNFMGHNVPWKLLKIKFYVHILHHKQLALLLSFSVSFIVSCFQSCDVYTLATNICSVFKRGGDSAALHSFKETKLSVAVRDPSSRVWWSHSLLNRDFHLLYLLTTVQQLIKLQKRTERYQLVKDNSWSLVFQKYFSAKTD